MSFNDGGAVVGMHKVSGPVPQLEMVEWVVDHHEAHGHLLVHGTSLGEIVSRAKAALACRVAGTPGGVRLKILHAGWWRAEPCRCRRSLASSNHPGWHYHRAAAGDVGAWRGAEVRLVLSPCRRGGDR
ncbi:hypothetical protein [Amycolatopsis sp. RTGN1]|uniref:hypothetical protein n=1 Tax=Amycolatopsis ponsaeliensis TaxID=2992142 RepID=UPI00254BCE7E|nr:hypothetical protein [Amycolatopsis sp. RTGN1]